MPILQPAFARLSKSAARRHQTNHAGLFREALPARLQRPTTALICLNAAGPPKGRVVNPDGLHQRIPARYRRRKIEASKPNNNAFLFRKMVRLTLRRPYLTIQRRNLDCVPPGSQQSSCQFDAYPITNDRLSVGQLNGIIA